MITPARFVFLALFARILAYNAPPPHVSEEMRFVDRNLHAFVDNLVRTNAYQWSNAATGNLNQAVLAQMRESFNQALGSITTSNFRQCDRLNMFCYQCENGAANVSAASVAFMVSAKLFLQKNGEPGSSVEEVGSLTYELLSNTDVPVWTASLACRANQSCYPSSDAQLMRGELVGSRKLTFKKEGNLYLINRINTGAMYTYFPSYEAGIEIFNVNRGPLELVPESIMEDFSMTGVFCIFAKRSIVYYLYRDLPFMGDPHN